MERWLLLPASTLAKHLHISERLAKRAKAEIARDHNWTGSAEEQAELDRGHTLKSDADEDALATAQVKARTRPNA